MSNTANKVESNLHGGPSESESSESEEVESNLHGGPSESESSESEEVESDLHGGPSESESSESEEVESNLHGGPSESESSESEEVESDLHCGPSESESSRKRKAHLIKHKLETIDYANKFSKHSAAKKFNVSRRSVMDWCEQEASLRQQQSNFLLLLCLAVAYPHCELQKLSANLLQLFGAKTGKELIEKVAGFVALSMAAEKTVDVIEDAILPDVVPPTLDPIILQKLVKTEVDNYLAELHEQVVKNKVVDANIVLG